MTGKYLEIIAIHGRTRQGSTEPFICKASNDQTYFVKGKSTAIVGLIKEWMGANLGRAFGLPIPDFNIALVDEALLAGYGADAVTELGTDPVFASQSIHPAHELNYSLVPNIDLKLQQDILIFDTWVQHNDRTLSKLGGNPNLIWDGEKLHVIDHNLIFAPDFSINQLRELHVFREQLNSVFGDSLLRAQFQTRMQAALSSWLEWWDNLPEEWRDLNDDLGLLNQDAIYQQLEQDAQGAIWTRLNT